MNLKYLFVSVVILVFFANCKSDDSDDLLPQEEQNKLDDQAIVNYLKNHYFDNHGRAKEIKKNNPDNHTVLYELAKQVDNGYWYVKNPNIVGEYRAVKDNKKDSILLQYDMKIFKAHKHNDTVKYNNISTFSSTTNTSGYPIWDPAFYYTKIPKGTNLDYYTIEGFVDGIKHFKSTNREADQTPAVNFQGLIIIPSRLAYERRNNALKIGYDQSIVVNFELYKVLDRK